MESNKKRKSSQSEKGEKKAKHIEIEFEDENKNSNSNTSENTKKEWKKAWEQICTVIDAAAPPFEIPSKEKRYQKLVKNMLVGRTTDARIDETFDELMKVGVTVENIRKMSESELATHIKAITGAKNKASSIKKATEIIAEKYDGDIPKEYKELLALPGIATVTMRYCWGKSLGITVDVHIHRVVNRLGWVKTSDANSTKKELEKFIPEDLWTDIERIYVFGQKVCKAVDPQCKTCPVNKLCPSCKN